MGLKKTLRVLLVEGLALLMLMVPASILARASGTDAVSPSGVSATTTITVSVQPTVIISLELPDTAEGAGGARAIKVKLAGNSGCRAYLAGTGGLIRILAGGQDSRELELQLAPLGRSGRYRDAVSSLRLTTYL